MLSTGFRINANSVINSLNWNSVNYFCLLLLAFLFPIGKIVSILNFFLRISRSYKFFKVNSNWSCQLYLFYQNSRYLNNLHASGSTPIDAHISWNWSLNSGSRRISSLCFEANSSKLCWNISICFPIYKTSKNTIIIL